MESKEQTIQELTEELQAKLPNSMQDTARRLAQLLYEIGGSASENENNSRISEERDDIRKIIEALSGETIQTQGTLITFGENDQLGDVILRDVTNRNVIHFHIFTPKSTSIISTTEDVILFRNFTPKSTPIISRSTLTTIAVMSLGSVGAIVIVLILALYTQTPEVLTRNYFSALVLISASLTVIGSLLLGLFRYLVSQGNTQEVRNSRVLTLSAIVTLMFVGLFGLITALIIQALRWITTGGESIQLASSSNLLISITANIVGATIILGIVSLIDHVRKKTRRDVMKEIHQRDSKYFDNNSTSRSRIN